MKLLVAFSILSGFALRTFAQLAPPVLQDQRELFVDSYLIDSFLSDTAMQAMGIDKTMWKGVSDAVLLTSRGGNSYERMFMQSFVRPGTNQQNWAARSTIPACGIIPTGKNEMSFFVTRAYGTKDIFLERMVLRVDGFASLHGGCRYFFIRHFLAYDRSP